MNNFDFIKKSETKYERHPRMSQRNIQPRAIKSRHLEGFMLFMGATDEMPENGDEKRFFFNTTTGVLSVWNPETELWVDIN